MNERSYTESLFGYQRVTTKVTRVGCVTIGGEAPVRLQSMTTTDTNDVNASAEQSLRIISAGGEIVRLTTQGEREAKSIGALRNELDRRGVCTPLVADVHFNPHAAEIAAGLVDAVRINPGNYTGEAKRFKEDADKLSDDEWHKLIVTKLTPLVSICREHGTAIRIGVNHGSLSDRVMAKYGDTAEGMVASCVEYLDAFEHLDFREIVISIKSSNTRVMVETVRLLSATMRERGTIYPLHLGVTEAGSDAEGRIKSCAGIGALLSDGLGDTIRVSLTEAPETEIPVARQLVEHIARLNDIPAIRAVDSHHYSPYAYKKRENNGSYNLDKEPVVCVYSDKQLSEADWTLSTNGNITDNKGQNINYVRLTLDELTTEKAGELRQIETGVVVGMCKSGNYLAEMRALSLELLNMGVRLPFLVEYKSAAQELTQYQIEMSADLGLMFIDGLADGIVLSNDSLDASELAKTGDLLLQATRARFSHTEFISCPACGRTLYDIQQTVRIIKERLGHLKGLKIGVMGCIVNGIGEMADADYGYVGAGRGKISLYRCKEVVRRSIDEAEALEALIDIIKEDGKWVEID